MLQFWQAEDYRNKVVSAIAQVEARSAICRLRKGYRISADEASIALNSIDVEMNSIFRQQVNQSVLDVASSLSLPYNLRALDAVQLGSAIVARGLLASPQMRFVAADQALLDAAKAEGFETWNPADVP